MTKEAYEHKSEYKPFEELKKRDELVERIMATTSHRCNRAYVNGIEAIGCEHSQLNTIDGRKKFLDTVVDTVCADVTAKPEDKLEQDIVLREFAGITRTELGYILGVKGEGFSYNEFSSLFAGVWEKMHSQMQRIAARDITEKHLPAIASYTGSKKLVDTGYIMNRADGIYLLRKYHQSGRITPSDIGERLMPGSGNGIARKRAA